MAKTSDKQESKNKNSLLIRLIPILIVSALIVHFQQNIIWNITESVNGRIGYITNTKPEKGDYVNFLFTHELLANREDLNDAKDNISNKFRLTKKLTCVPGDRLKTVEKNLYCNGEKVATALDRTGSGKPLQPFQWDGMIPKGKAIVLGETDDSFDSRYWGFIDIEKLNKVVLLASSAAVSH